MEQLIDRFGEPHFMAFSGAAVGLLFGAAAYHSRFCLRAATIEVATGRPGARLSLWLVAFLAALGAVQIAIFLGVLDVSSARQLAATGSMSGAIIGGLMFGVGMILARGCAARLLVLSASGNLRAIITGLVLTLTAQAALSGILSPARETLATLWTIPGGEARQLFATGSPLVSAALLLTPLAYIAAFVFGLHRGAEAKRLVTATLVGLAVFAGWMVTYAIAAASFEVVAVQSVTFTGPSTDTLMTLVDQRDVTLSFGQGLVLGVFTGALITAIFMGEARIQRFEPDVPMERYLVGGMLMGFGSMLAGGCAVGAGMSGGSILALTPWVAVFCMWLGAMATQLVITSGTRRQTA